jgi:hypothetical protein
MECPAPASTRSTSAEQVATQFDTSCQRFCSPLGIPRHVPRSVYTAFKRRASHLGISFDETQIFRQPDCDLAAIPSHDVQLLDAFIQRLGLAATFRMFRDQTLQDPRPNKALRPWLYRQHLASYPGLEQLCAIAESGVIPTWLAPVPRIGTRPYVANSRSAEAGATIVRTRLLAGYYQGRCLLASMTTFNKDPGFQASSFALVPEKHIPISKDGRVIHNFSLPQVGSINAVTDKRYSPDATWDEFSSIACRVLDLNRRFPGAPVYALGADIADAFPHVPIHADHASAFGGHLPQSSVGIVSGAAVFGWTASPGFFAVLGKAVRHYQRTGSSVLMGFKEPFWIFQWVDDIVLIEVDVDDRLLEAERRLRDGVKLVFGNSGWHASKFSTWARHIHAVGIDWNIPEGTVTIPPTKVAKTRSVVESILNAKHLSEKQLNSLVGVLRHVLTFIPVAKPFIQRITAVQLRVHRNGEKGCVVTPFMRLDLKWWKDLVFENEFAGVPMSLFGQRGKADDVWLLQVRPRVICITSTKWNRRVVFEELNTADPTTVAEALSQTVVVWSQMAPAVNRGSLVCIQCEALGVARLINSMNCGSEPGQQALRNCAMSLARCGWMLRAIHSTWKETVACDIHKVTNVSILSQDALQNGPREGLDCQENKPYTSRPSNLNTPQSLIVPWERTAGISNIGNPSAGISSYRFGSMNCRESGKPAWLVCTRASALWKATISPNVGISIKHSTPRWQRLPLRTRQLETPGSITMIQNLSWLLRATREPTAVWTGSNQLLRPCCGRCTMSFKKMRTGTVEDSGNYCGDQWFLDSSSSTGALSSGVQYPSTAQQEETEYIASGQTTWS